MFDVTAVSFGFLVVWLAIVGVYALWSARDRKLDPAPPEPPEQHHH